MHGTETSDPGEISIIPKPVVIKQDKGVLQWDGTVKVVISGSGEEREVVRLLIGYLGEYGIEAVEMVGTSQEDSPEAGHHVRLLIEADDRLGVEGYTLRVGKQGVTIRANTGAGLFYGCQTLIQLLNGGQIPFVEIVDYPRFGYRGLHLDVSRHMFPVSFIKRYIDLMSRYKINRFHWHLTDDQGWRIEIKSHPRLQEVAAFRKETVVGYASTRTRNQPQQYDGIRYGGYYTQEEVRDIVQYAMQRNVTIIPEIELPGHAQAALAAYPELGCTGGPYEVATTWGIFPDVYCAGKEETFSFLEDVLNEVIELFPGKYIHIGGDECLKTRWKNCQRCQNRIKREALKDEAELQSDFIRRIEKYLNTRGRQIIGWDEILEGGLAPNATVMSWRGEKGGIAAASMGHDVIMTPGNWCYLDHYQDTTGNEPLAIGGYTPVSEVYGYEPVPPSLSEAESAHIIGAQCNVWTEYMKTPEHVEYMVYPRAIAMAEVVWSPREGRDYADFVNRMRWHVNVLKQLGVNYAKHIEKEFVGNDPADDVASRGTTRSKD